MSDYKERLDRWLSAVIERDRDRMIERARDRMRSDIFERLTSYHKEIKPNLIDGLTGAECLTLYIERQQEHGHSADCYPMTPAQLAVARDLWSAQLRARVQASEVERKTRETSVCVPIDVEDLEW